MFMKLNFTVSEINALSSAGIFFREDGEYSEDEALELLEQVREAEVSVAQFTSGDRKKQFDTYAAIGDKLFAQIPEE